MFKINFKTLLINLIIVIAIFLIDRISKIYIIEIAEIEGTVDIYINQYLNFFLIWNNGVAFGLLSFDERIAYNFITAIIVTVIFLILVMVYKSENRSVYFLLFILGGSLGNLFDRIYYSAVPDFIDLHIRDFHWFIFNVADIFITFGVIFLILIELKSNKKNDKSI